MTVIPDVQKIHHHSLRSSIEGLFFEWIYGDGWRLVEIFLSGQTVLRGLSILFLGGMAAEYYATFPYRDQWVGWDAARPKRSTSPGALSSSVWPALGRGTGPLPRRGGRAASQAPTPKRFTRVAISFAMFAMDH